MLKSLAILDCSRVFLSLNKQSIESSICGLKMLHLRGVRSACRRTSSDVLLTG
jgi:hypothetical protein